MAKLKHFETPQAVVDYIASEIVSTLQDDYDRMTHDKYERQHYTYDDRAEMRTKLHEVRVIAEQLPRAFELAELIARMKTEDEFKDDAPPSEDWISTLNDLIVSARSALGLTKRPRYTLRPLEKQLLDVVKRVSAYEEERRNKGDHHFHDEELDEWKALIAKAEGR